MQLNRFNTPGVWIRRTEPNPDAKLRLFCLPYAGGGASLFRRWAEAVPPEIDILPIQLPGREDRFSEAPFNRMFPLVRALVESVYPWLDLPFAIFGHSLGALVGFELARYLRWSLNRTPEHLFVSACPAPQVSHQQSPIYALPEPDFIAGIRQFHTVPPAFLEEPDLLELFLPLLRADFAVYETYIYTPEAPLECPITAFCGGNDPNASLLEVGAWHSQSSISFIMRVFPGDHFFIHTSEKLLVDAIAEMLINA